MRKFFILLNLAVCFNLANCYKDRTSYIESLPDLKVLSLTVPLPVLPGQPFDITWEIQNVANLDCNCVTKTSRACSQLFQLEFNSGNGIWETIDQKVTPVEEIQPGKKKTSKRTVTINQPGEYRVTIIVDYLNEVDELTKSNNEKTVQF